MGHMTRTGFKDINLFGHLIQFLFFFSPGAGSRSGLLGAASAASVGVLAGWK